MANSIRTPREGTNANSKRIAAAVDDEEWQKFRVSMKGVSTRKKLDMLKEYYGSMNHDKSAGSEADCTICIRVDNYIKALARGGQLLPGVSLKSVIADKWNPTIKK